MAYKRILLKLSGEALMGEKPYGIDPAIVQSISEDVSKVVENNVQLAIVVGGGNIFRGLKGSADGMDRPFKPSKNIPAPNNYCKFYIILNYF